MKLRLVDKDARLRPRLCCDNRGAPIEDAARAMSLWEAEQAATEKGASIAVRHVACDRDVRQESA
jgi:hypothetical protein